MGDHLMNKLISNSIAFFFILCFISIMISGCISTGTYMVEMRDGVHLATDVYLPRANVLPHGSILVRTPYNKNYNRDFGREVANAGWPIVIQDMRGRFASEGTDTVFRHAQTDGPDTLSWIADQHWSNGKIATYGGSAKGMNQYFMAGASPPNLACQFIYVATPNLYRYAFQQGGQFRQSLVELWLKGQGSLHMLDEYFAHENYTMDYWTNVSMDDKWGNVQVPAIHVGGWYDCFAQGTIEGFMGYQYQGGAGAKGHSKLIMGPWTHGGGRIQGELTYPENAVDTFSYLMLVDMIEQYTMNKGTNFQQWPAVRYYVMGDVDDDSAPGNEWLISDEWPVIYEPVPVYLSKDNSLGVKVSTSSSFSYIYDPTDPVPTLGGQNLNIAKGPYDQRPVEQREDVILFTSDVLTEPVWITGPVSARLFVSSTCVDTDFTVKLTDVYPDGRSMLITDGILRMRNRNGVDHWEFMQPGEIYEVEVDLWSTSYIFNEGHQIRVAISSSNAPRFLPNPNTADGIRKNVTYAIAENTVYVGNDCPSRIILPLIHLDYEAEVQKSVDHFSQTLDQFKKEHGFYYLFSHRFNQLRNLQ